MPLMENHVGWSAAVFRFFKAAAASGVKGLSKNYRALSKIYKKRL